jgi:hypothetical protein
VWVEESRGETDLYKLVQVTGQCLVGISTSALLADKLTH